MTVIKPDPLRWKAKRDPKVLDRAWERLWKGSGPISRAKAVITYLTDKRPSAGNVDGLASTLRATKEQREALKRKYSK